MIVNSDRRENGRFELTTGNFETEGGGFADIKGFAKTVGLRESHESTLSFRIVIEMGRGESNVGGRVAFLVVTVLRAIA